MKIAEIFEGKKSFVVALEELAKKHHIPADTAETSDDEIKLYLTNQAAEHDMDAFEADARTLAKKYKVELLNFDWSSDDLTIFIED